MSTADVKRLLVRLALVVIACVVNGSVVLSQTDEEEERAKYQPYRDYGTDWRLGSIFGITPEDGVLIGPGAIVYKFGFRTFPYVYRMELVGGITLKTGRFKIMYTAGFPDLSKRVALDILAYASELEVRNFYGFGNNTFRDGTLERNDFYRVASRQYFVRPVVKFKLSEIAGINVGASFKHFDIRHRANRFLTRSFLDSLGRSRSVLGAGVEFQLAFGDAPVATRNGFFAAVSAWNYPDPFKSRKPYQRYAADMRGYVTAGLATLALRAAGEKLDGDFPFYESAFLGGPSSLRGYNLNRFAGDASIVGNAELRVELGKLKLIVPTTIGLFAFGEAGRVYVNSNSPGGWHADAGGGVSLAPVAREMTLSISVASSTEGVFVSGGFGFAF